MEPTKPDQPAQVPRVSVPDHCMHKNRLQTYAQRSALPLPTYHTVNEGLTHLPKFRSTVLVDGVSYTSHTFLHRKEAEQDAAKVALDSILQKVKQEGCPMILEDKTFCKAILNEFAVKVNLDLPTYTTTQSEGKFPTFISTLSFHGKMYPGIPGRNKKEAEQLGAFNVIQHILGTEVGPILSQIINTKRPIFEELRKAKKNFPIVPYPDNSIQPKNVQETPPAKALKKPRLEHEPGSDPAVNISPVLGQPSSSDPAEQTGLQGTTATTSAKKPSRKNKRKGQNEMAADIDLKAGALPIVQATQCSVAQ